jgi:hypothetical protein
MKSNLINQINSNDFGAPALPNAQAYQHTNNIKPNIIIPTQQQLPTISELNSNTQQNYRIPEYNSHNIPTIQHTRYTFRLMQIESEKAAFTSLYVLLVIMIFLSVMSFFKCINMLSFYQINADDNSLFINYECFNMVMIIVHIGCYLIGLIGVDMQLVTVFEYSSCGLVVIDLIYFIWFCYVDSFLITWMMNMFYLCINICVYSEARKLRRLFNEERVLKMHLNILSL